MKTLALILLLAFIGCSDATGPDFTTEKPIPPYNTGGSIAGLWTDHNGTYLRDMEVGYGNPVQWVESECRSTPGGIWFCAKKGNGWETLEGYKSYDYPPTYTFTVTYQGQTKTVLFTRQ